MSKPILEDLFSFSCRRNRKSYLYVTVISMAITFLGGVFVFGLLVLLGKLSDYLHYVSAVLTFLVLITSISVLIPILVISVSTTTQRIRDCGHTGVWFFVSWVPVIGWIPLVALFFLPGDEGDNRYGPDCLK